MLRSRPNLLAVHLFEWSPTQRCADNANLKHVLVLSFQGHGKMLASNLWKYSEFNLRKEKLFLGDWAPPIRISSKGTNARITLDQQASMPSRSQPS